LSGLDEAGVIELIACGELPRSDILLGIGDDAAVLQPPPGKLMVLAVDTLNEGVHFPKDIEPRDLGHRAVAVNLSDLAAMGATPAWALLSLSMPTAEADWVSGFAEGARRLARRHDVAIVGGDTVRGPLSVCVQVVGFVDPGRFLARGNAKPGDSVFVTGHPGDASAGLAVLQSGGGDNRLTDRFLRPQPRTDIGRAIAGVASAAIDISDGLVTDLGRLAAASGVRLVVELRDLPLSEALVDLMGAGRALEHALGGGDDYELCFTVEPGRVPALDHMAADWDCGVTRIGYVEVGEGVVLLRDGKPCPDTSVQTWQHFPKASS
jgi:thiamine-monophosphate kinase